MRRRQFSRIDGLTVLYFFQFEGERLSMRADDLDQKELLELDPEGCVISFAGRRAFLVDAVAMGLLASAPSGSSASWPPVSCSPGSASPTDGGRPRK